MSEITTTIPAENAALTSQEVRNNFSTAHDEIEALETGKADANVFVKSLNQNRPFNAGDDGARLISTTQNNVTLTLNAGLITKSGVTLEQLGTGTITVVAGTDVTFIGSNLATSQAQDKIIIERTDFNNTYSVRLESVSVTSVSLDGTMRNLPRKNMPHIMIPNAANISATGLVTGIVTALPRVFAGVTVVELQSASHGVGQYYATWSSNTSCQLYTDEAATVQATFTAGAYTRTASITVRIEQANLPANSLGANGSIYLNALVSLSGTGGNRQCGFYVGNTKIMHSFLSSGVITHSMDTKMTNCNATNVQRMKETSNGDTGTDTDTATDTDAIDELSIDTTVAMRIDFLYILTVNTTYMIIEHMTINYIKQD